MPKSLTFIHAADLHLGAPFRGLAQVSETWSVRLMSAIHEAFERVVDAALTREVDFVVIAGDVFDATRSSYGDYLRFFKGMKRLGEAGIPVYLVAGNHDPITSWKQGLFLLPENAHMLSATQPEFHLFERDGEPLCIIGGRSYYNQTWPMDECIASGITRKAGIDALREDFPQAGSAPFAVGVLHTGLNLDPIKAPVKPSVLMAAGMDYWACGHIHMPYAYPSRENQRIVFSGCIQGRDIKETGPRGINHVTLTEGKPPEVTFIPTASVVWQQLPVDVSVCEALPDVADRIMRELFRVNGKAHCEEMVSRIRLVGSTHLHEVLQRPDVREDMRKHVNDSYSAFFCDLITDETTTPRDKDALREEGLFPAVMLQVSSDLLSRPDDSKAFLQDEFLKRNLQLPSSCAARVEELSARAEDLVLDLLSQGEAR